MEFRALCFPIVSESRINQFVLRGLSALVLFSLVFSPFWRHRHPARMKNLNSATCRKEVADSFYLSRRAWLRLVTEFFISFYLRFIPAAIDYYFCGVRCNFTVNPEENLINSSRIDNLRPSGGKENFRPAQVDIVALAISMQSIDAAAACRSNGDKKRLKFMPIKRLDSNSRSGSRIRSIRTRAKVATRARAAHELDSNLALMQIRPFTLSYLYTHTRMPLFS